MLKRSRRNYPVNSTRIAYESVHPATAGGEKQPSPGERPSAKWIRSKSAKLDLRLLRVRSRVRRSLRNDRCGPLPIPVLIARLETISHPRLGENVPRRAKIGFDLLTQLTDKHPQIIGLLHAVTTPDCIQNRAVR